ncbi:MAG: methyl-accepting chemotaxis protein [Desulfuromonadaceae bacterium]|nr:methyl-accepting chemotaxis protein [Desulfuromonadaceae bacterium]
MQWFYDLSTRAKIIFSFGLMLILLAIIIVTAYTSITAIKGAQRELVQSGFQSVLDLVEIRSHQNHTRAEMIEMTITSDRSKLQAMAQDIKERTSNINQNVKALMELKKGDHKFITKLQELADTREAYRKTVEEEISLIFKGKNEEARTLGVGDQDNRYNRIRDITYELGKAEEESARQRILQSDQMAKTAALVFLIVGASAFVFCIVVTIVLNKAIAKPLTEITGIAERIAAGELDINVPSTTRKDEVGLLILMFRRMVDNIKGYALTTGQIAAGNLISTVAPKSEKDVMGNALAIMGSNLREITREIIEGVNVLASSSSEIMASTNQVASGASETAVAVSETSSTVEEVKQTAMVSSQKARNVADAAQKSVLVAQVGRRSVEESIVGMGRIQSQMEAIAESIVRLSEQSQTIGEIIATVNDLAEQSNLLAVNAAIEAAKAGEQGKGFAVVAQEVKSLAQQSKEATAQVRTILNDIQKATNAAVMATEQGNKAVEDGVRQSKEAGEAIRQMGESIDESAQAAVQIATSSQQQLTGMDQVALAMENIRQASEQNVTGMRQVEITVQGLHDLGQKLKDLVGRYTV